MSIHQDLYGNDFLKRINFCNWIYYFHVLHSVGLFLDGGDKTSFQTAWRSHASVYIGIWCFWYFNPSELSIRIEALEFQLG